MYRKLARALKNLHRGQRGMTGLETAIILIAMITVASVMSYTILSAGLYTAEKSRDIIHAGLSATQNTMELKGNIIGLSPNGTELQTVKFNVALTVPSLDAKVDTGAIVVNYLDDGMYSEGVSANFTLSGGSTERGAVSTLEFDEQFVASIAIPASANITAYEVFSIELVPISGASFTITRRMPAVINMAMNLE